MFELENKSLKQYLSSLGTVTTVTQDVANANNGWVKTMVNIRDGSNKAREMIVSLNDAEKRFVVESNKTTSGILDKKNAMLGWAEAIQTAFKRLIQWTVAGTAIFGTIRLLREGFQTLKEMETESANIMKVLSGKNNTEIKKQGSFLDENAIKLAKQYGQSVMDVQKSMGVWARQYKDVHAIVNMTNASLLAATATDISFESSVKDLSAIIAEWGMKTKDAGHIVNVLNQESNSYRITAQGLADALTKTSAAAKASGMTFEELSGIITTGIQVLGVEGNQMGTILTRIFGRIRGNKGAKEALESLGVDIAQPLNKILTQLAAKWDTLSKGQKQSLAIVIAGNQHWNRFIGIMDNWKTVVEATTKAYFSHNSALNEIQIMMSTTQKRVAQVNAAWQQFIHQNAGVLNATQGLVYVLGAIVNGMSKVPPVVLGVSVALIGLVPVIIKIISLLREMTILELISKMLINWKTGLVLAIAGVATYLFAMGKNAQDAAWKLQDLQSKQEALKASMDGLTNNVRGILYLKEQYAALRDEMSKLNPQSK
jgi:TP901 family phage tail tape measure protein